MSEFNNVSVVRNANVYFEGAVTSRVIKFADGSTKTLGLMQPGEYEFGTELKELMEIQQGDVDVLLPGEDSWQSFSAGDSFEVPANSTFKITAKSLTDYCCSYLA